MRKKKIYIYALRGQHILKTTNFKIREQVISPEELSFPGLHIPRTRLGAHDAPPRADQQPGTTMPAQLHFVQPPPPRPYGSLRSRLTPAALPRSPCTPPNVLPLHPSEGNCNAPFYEWKTATHGGSSKPHVSVACSRQPNVRFLKPGGSY